MSQRLLTIKRVVAPTDRESVAHAGGGQRLKTQVRKPARSTDVPGIGNDECAIALMKRAKGSPLFSLRRRHVWAHGAAGSAAGTPKVPSTTSTKFLSSRRMNRFVCDIVKFSRASKSTLRRAR